jgi:hypothetical protein
VAAQGVVAAILGAIARKPKPIEVEELKEVILRAIVREFGSRPLDRDTATKPCRRLPLK